MNKRDFDLDFDIKGVGAAADIKYEFRLPNGTSVFIWNHAGAHDLLQIFGGLGEGEGIEDVLILKSPNHSVDAAAAVSEIIRNLNLRKKLRTSRSYIHIKLRKRMQGHGYIL